MNKHIISILFLLIAVTTSAQTLNVVTGNVTYAFSASKVGEMGYKDGTTLTISGKVFTISDINKIYVDESEVTDNEVAVTYNGTNATVTVAGNVAQYITPTISGAHVSIVQSNTDDVDGDEITYSLAGSSSDGEFYMKGSYKASIDLNGLTLTNATPVYSGAALHIQDGKRISISVKKDTENTLTDCASPSDDLAQKACLYVKGHPEFKGKGTLNVYGKYKHAIKAGEYIAMKNCTINVRSAVSDGFNCNEYFLQESGAIAISGVGDDGIQAEIDEDADVTAETTDHEDENSGSIYMVDGNITASITATAAKGLKADGNISVAAGTINVTTFGNATYDSDDQDTKACAGMSADGNIDIAGGDITLKSTGKGGKGLKCDGMLTVTGGTINASTTGSKYTYSTNLTSSPKAIKAGTRTLKSGRTAKSHTKSDPAYDFTGGISIKDGTIYASASYHEAIESKSTIDISGGTIYAQSQDDAINSASTFIISGGSVCGYSTGNDGMDANGDFFIKGGTVYSIASGGAEVGIDANSEQSFSLTLSGGNVVAIGGVENGSTLSQTCYQLSSSSSGSTGRGGFGGGGFGPGQQGGGNQTWSANTWYGLYSNGTLAIAFKTPSSGGSALVVSTSGTATLKSEVTVSGSTIWNGMGATSASDGSTATLTTYSGGNFR